jgi:hypothetical protein
MMTDKLRTGASQRGSDLAYPHRRRAPLPANSPMSRRKLQGLALVACFAAILSLGCGSASAADYSAGGGVVNAPSGNATAVGSGASTLGTSATAFGAGATALGNGVTEVGDRGRRRQHRIWNQRDRYGFEQQREWRSGDRDGLK